jgi:regulator of protease activity HflC (stomatin/prohibitin superfamily)
MANPLEGTGITLKNFEIKSFEYKDKVKAQISKQQEALMAVATAITEAKKAEQQKLTIVAVGKSKVAQAKYEEEQTKVRAVVVAQRNKEVQELDASRDKAVAVIAGEKRKEVATLDRDAAKLKKEELILLGQGESERKKLVIRADGALTQKLATYENVMGVWAKAFSKRPVPTVMMGGGKGGVDGDAIAMSDVLSLMALKQLGLDLNVNKGKVKN